MSRTPETGQPARKRRWLQFHLSTAIVLMFVAGGLLWANTKERVYCSQGVIWDHKNPRLGGCWFEYVRGYGFPFAFVQSLYSESGTYPGSGAFNLRPRASADRWDWLWGSLALNALVALAVLLATGVSCEWYIRRRAAQGRGPLQIHLVSAVAVLAAMGILVYLNNYTRPPGWPFYVRSAYMGKTRLGLDASDPMLWLNLACAVLIVAATAVICEWLVRKSRRAAKAP